MKKAIFNGIAAIALVFFTHSLISCQETNDIVKVRVKDYNYPSDPAQPATKQNEPVYLNNINSKAIRNFVSAHKHVTDALWIKSRHGYVVFFTENNINHRAYYGTNGTYSATVREYRENLLPRDIRHIVKSSYYDYAIYLVIEISTEDKIVYMVKLEGEKSWKTVKVVDEELTVVENWVKARELKSNL